MENNTKSILSSIETSSSMILSAIGYIGSVITDALSYPNNSNNNNVNNNNKNDSVVTIVALESRLSDSFPGNENLDATDSEKERVTLCFVGTPGNREFLHEYSKQFAVGNKVCC
jgi:hypothetical protein